MSSITTSLHSLLLLSSFNIPAYAYAILFYIFTLLYTRGRLRLQRNLASLAVVLAILAFSISGLIGLALGNNISFMLRYSGGALLLPLYFFLSSLSQDKLLKLVRCILFVACIFAILSVLFLLSTLAGSIGTSSLLSSILGEGSRSGFQDTRFYSLTLLTSNFPLSFLLLFFPRGFLQLFSISKNFRSILLLRISGTVFGFAGLFLLFSKSYVFYFLYIAAFALSTSHSALYRLNRRLILSFCIVLTIVSFAFNYITSYIDPSRLASVLDFLNYDSNYQRYEQISYYLGNGFTIIGDGLGSSFVNTPILRSWESPYGIENSILNVFFKFGAFSLLFLPFLYFIYSCFIIIHRISLERAVHDDLRLLAIATTPSFSYFILVSTGNPILFHVQLDFLLLIFFVFSQRYISYPYGN